MKGEPEILRNIAKEQYKKQNGIYCGRTMGTIKMNDNTLIIHQHLPSYNDYIYECRSHWSKGAKFKQQIETAIAYEIMASRTLKPVDEPVIMQIIWYERGHKRDADNIQSAKKFILDALVRQGILPDDRSKYVRQIYDYIMWDAQEDKVVVRICSEGGNEKHKKESEAKYGI